MIERLSAITQQIIAPELNYVSVREACIELMQFFYEAVDFKETNENNQHILTKVGLAVSPYSAAFCIVDFIRTRNFLKAIKEAIEDTLNKEPNKPVIVFYAGTGPFATLVVPLTTLFSVNQLKFILVDINENSIDYLKKLIHILNIEDYVIDIVKTDASTYILPGHQQHNILLSETMKPALDKEPQVSIIANLISQCNKIPILIPQAIKVDLVLQGNRVSNNAEDEYIRNLIIFDTTMAYKIANNINSINIFSNGIEVEIMQPKSLALSQIALNTQINLYKNHWLKEHETSLTISHKLFDTANFTYPIKFNVRYCIMEKPGFVFTQIT
jgi:predicted RNA methylase